MIKLQCKCGHTLNLPEKLMGQKIRCKRCSKVMRVPSSQGRVPAAPVIASSPELMVQGTRACPGCGTTYPPAVVVCTTCGLNIDSGAMLYASVEEQSTPVAPLDEARVGWFQRLLGKLGFGKKD